MDYIKRTAVVTAGLLICGVGCYCMIRATNIGIGAWETFQTGLMMRTGLAYGTCTVIVSFAVILVDLLLKGKIGIGTVLNALIIGKSIDLISEFFDVLPPAETVPAGIAYLLIGQIIQSVGMVVYMRPGLGCGPRDTLMVVLGKKLPRLNIGAVRFAIDICVFLLGALMGAPYGIGTVFAIGAFSFVLQAVFRAFGFESRKVKHEDISDSLRRMRSLKGARD